MPAADVTQEVLDREGQDVSGEKALFSLFRDMLGVVPGMTVPTLHRACGLPAFGLARHESYTRSTAAFQQGMNGRLALAAAGVPRGEWLPDGYRGWKIEAMGLNVLTYSEDCANPAWNKGGVVCLGGQASPDGKAAATRVLETSGGDGLHSLWHAVPTQIGSEYCFSFYAKAAGRRVVAATIYHSTTKRTIFDLANGTILAGDGAIEPLGNDWFRCRVCFTATAPQAYARIYVQNGGEISYEGDGESGILLWGCQVEAGSCATSYIKTEGTAVIRGSDVWKIGIDSQWFNMEAGTVFVAARGTPVLSGTRNYLLHIDDETRADALAVFREPGQQNIVFSVVAAQKEVCRLQIDDHDCEKTLRLAFAWDATSFLLAANGQSCLRAPKKSFPQALRSFRIGASCLDREQWGGLISQVVYVPCRLDGQRLQRMTQP